MIVAVAAVRVVQVPRHEVVDVVAVGHGFVAAAGRVGVALLVARALVVGRASLGVRAPDLERALVNVPFVRVVQVAVVQVVDVVAVPDGDVAAARAVNVIVVRMGVVAHGCSLISEERGAAVGSPAWANAARMSSRTWSSASE